MSFTNDTTFLHSPIRSSASEVWNKEEDVSKTLDQILTAEELERVQKDGFNADQIFGVGNYFVPISVALWGHNPRKHDNDERVGELVLNKTKNSREIVAFVLTGDPTHIPTGYLVRHDHPSHGTSFVVRPFLQGKEDPFVMIHRVRYEENVSAREVELKALNMHGWAEWNISKEDKGSVHFDEVQWNDIWNVLNIWLPKE